MREYFPLLVAGAIVGLFSAAFIIAYALMKNKKEAIGFDRTLKDLNQIVAEQALTIDRLEKEVRFLELHGAGEFVRPLSEEVPPPHY